MSKQLKKRNAGRKETSTSYAMDNAKISLLARFGVPMFFCLYVILQIEKLAIHKYLQLFCDYC
jgi:hypothetical protein